MTEYELKFLLSKEEYECLHDFLLPNATEMEHSNYYYDTDDFYLYRKDITCRIRKKNGTYYATKKYHDRVLGKSEELTKQVDGVPCLFPLFKESAVYRGSLKTKRTEFLYDPGICILLDRNAYLGVVDFELEIEYEQNRKESVWEAATMLAEHLVKQGVCASPEELLHRVGQGGSKYRRFVRRYMELCGIEMKDL